MFKHINKFVREITESQSSEQSWLGQFWEDPVPASTDEIYEIDYENLCGWYSSNKAIGEIFWYFSRKVCLCWKNIKFEMNH